MFLDVNESIDGSTEQTSAVNSTASVNISNDATTKTLPTPTNSTGKYNFVITKF